MSSIYRNGISVFYIRLGLYVLLVPSTMSS